MTMKPRFTMDLFGQIRHLSLCGCGLKDHFFLVSCNPFKPVEISELLAISHAIGLTPYADIAARHTAEKDGNEIT